MSSSEAGPVTNAPEQTISAPTPGVKLRALVLHELEFKRFGGQAPPAELEVPTRFRLGTHRLAEDALGVEFSLEIEQEDVVAFRIVYRAVFVRETDRPAPEDDLPFWRSVAGRVAPIVIFPYMRETFTGLAAKAGLPQLFLPVLNIGGIFPSESIAVQVTPPPKLD